LTYKQIKLNKIFVLKYSQIVGRCKNCTCSRKMHFGLWNADFNNCFGCLAVIIESLITWNRRAYFSLNLPNLKIQAAEFNNLRKRVIEAISHLLAIMFEFRAWRIHKPYNFRNGASLYHYFRPETSIFISIESEFYADDILFIVVQSSSKNFRIMFATFISSWKA